MPNIKRTHAITYTMLGISWGYFVIDFLVCLKYHVSVSVGLSAWKHQRSPMPRVGSVFPAVTATEVSVDIVVPLCLRLLVMQHWRHSQCAGVERCIRTLGVEVGVKWGDKNWTHCSYTCMPLQAHFKWRSRSPRLI